MGAPLRARCKRLCRARQSGNSHPAVSTCTNLREPAAERLCRFRRNSCSPLFQADPGVVRYGARARGPLRGSRQQIRQLMPIRIAIQTIAAAATRRSKGALVRRRMNTQATKSRLRTGDRHVEGRVPTPKGQKRARGRQGEQYEQRDPNQKVAGHSWAWSGSAPVSGPAHARDTK